MKLLRRIATVYDNNSLCDDQHLEKTKQHRSQISICHLNTQSVLSKFNEYRLMIDPYNMTS